jgi:hypothetical protein
VRNTVLIALVSVALVVISGCELVSTVAYPLVPDREDAPDVPTVVHEDTDSIMLWYDKFIGEQKHDEAKAMIAEHCGKRGFKIEVEELADSFTMMGTCI